LIEQRSRQVRQASLAGRVERRSSANDHSHADHRLLVVKDRDDLQPVVERPDFVGWELNIVSRKRTRRTFGRP
jgi:hypothetical protein